MNLQDKIRRVKLQNNEEWLKEVKQIFQEKEKNKNEFKNNEDLEKVKVILLEQIEHLRNITIMVEEDNSKEDVLDKYLNSVTIKKFKEKEFLYHQRDKCDYVYLVLDGLVSQWEPKLPQELLKEMDLTNQKKNSMKKYEKCYIEHEREFYEKEIQNLEEQLKQYRIQEEDEFLRSEEKRYFPLPSTTNYKKIKYVRQGNFIGESESVYGSKMEYTYVAMMDTTVLKISAKLFTGIFDLQVRKVEFSYQQLCKAFPNSNLDSLTWLSYQADEEYYLYNQKIFEEGDNLKCLYMIRSGSVQIKKTQYVEDETVNNTKKLQKGKKIQIAILGAGEIIGSEALYSSKKGMQYEAISYEAPFARIYKFTKSKLDKIIYKLDDIKLKLDLKKLGKSKLEWIADREKQLKSFNDKIQEEKNTIVKQFRKVKKAQTLIRTALSNNLNSENNSRLNSMNNSNYSSINNENAKMLNQSQSLIQDQFSNSLSPLKRYDSNSNFNNNNIAMLSSSLFQRGSRRNQTDLFQMNRTASQRDMKNNVDVSRFNKSFQRSQMHKTSIMMYQNNNQNQNNNNDSEIVDNIQAIEEEDQQQCTTKKNIQGSLSHVNSERSLQYKKASIHEIQEKIQQLENDQKEKNLNQNQQGINNLQDNRPRQISDGRLLQKDKNKEHNKQFQSVHQSNLQSPHNESLPLIQNKIYNSLQQQMYSSSNNLRNYNNNFYSTNRQQQQQNQNQNQNQINNNNKSNQDILHKTMFFNNKKKFQRTTNYVNKQRGQNQDFDNNNIIKMYQTHNYSQNLEKINTSQGQLFSPLKQSQNQNQSMNNSISIQNSSSLNVHNITQNLVFKDIQNQREIQQLFQQETSRDKVSYKDFVNEVRYIKKYEQYKKMKMQEGLGLMNPEFEFQDCENQAKRQIEMYKSNKIQGEEIESFVSYKERLLQNVIYDQNQPLIVMDKKLYDQNQNNVEFQFKAKKLISEQLLNNQKLTIKSSQTPVVENINKDLRNIQKQYAKNLQKQIRNDELDDGIYSKQNEIKNNKNFQFHYLSQLPKKQDLDTLKNQFEILEQEEIQQKQKMIQKMMQQQRKYKNKSMDFQEYGKKLKPLLKTQVGKKFYENNNNINNINNNESIIEYQINNKNNKFNNNNNDQLLLHKREKNYENLSIGIDFIYSDKTQKNLMHSFRNQNEIIQQKNRIVKNQRGVKRSLDLSMQNINNISNNNNNYNNSSQKIIPINNNEELSIIEPNNNSIYKITNNNNNSQLEECIKSKNTQDYVNSLENEMEYKYENQQKQLLEGHTSPYQEQQINSDFNNISNVNNNNINNTSILNNHILVQQNLEVEQQNLQQQNQQDQNKVNTNNNSNQKNNNQYQFITKSQQMFNQTVNFKSNLRSSLSNGRNNGININQRQKNIKALQLNRKSKKLLNI